MSNTKHLPNKDEYFERLEILYARYFAQYGVSDTSAKGIKKIILSITHDRLMQLESFVNEIYPYLDSDTIAQHSSRMDKVRAKLTAKAQKIMKQS